MSDLVLFLVLAGAAYRLTRLVTTDSILDRPRDWWFLHFPPNREWARRYRVVWNEARGEWNDAGVWFPMILRVRKPNGGMRVSWNLAPSPRRKTSKLGQLVECPWCIGFWLSGLVVALADHYASIPLPLAWWWALSAAVGLAAKVGG